MELTPEQLAEYERRATMVERERCAKIADEVQKSMYEECDFGAGIVAKAIRGHG